MPNSSEDVKQSHASAIESYIEKYVGIDFTGDYRKKVNREIEDNNKVSMLFFWPLLSRQIRIDGVCIKTTDAISEDYFNSRPRSSQIGAWASHQSEVLKSRQELEDRVAKIDKQYSNKIPRPQYWGGYQINPTQIEFWQGRPSRLHDRLVLTLEGGEWKTQRINP